MTTDLNHLGGPNLIFRPFPNRTIYRNDHVDQLSDLDPAEKASAEQYRAQRIKSYEFSHQTEDPDQRLVSYPPPHPETYYQKLRSPEEAKTRFFGFCDGFFGKVLTAFQKVGVKAFVIGSSPLAATCHSANFEPDDLDMYLQHIDQAQIRQIDEVLHRLKAPDERILVVRRPITIGWWFLGPDDQIRNQVQLNVMQIDHWIYAMEDYHSDLVCLGYDVQRGEFRYHQQRWDDFVRNPGINWFSNIYSCDVMFTLIHATNKYLQRGFNVKALIRNQDGSGYTVGRVDTFPLIDAINPDQALWRLLKFRWTRNMVFATHAPEIFSTEEKPAPIWDMFKYLIDYPDYYYRAKNLNRAKTRRYRELQSDSSDSSPETFWLAEPGCGHQTLLEDFLAANAHPRYQICPQCRHRFHEVKLVSEVHS